MAEDYRAVAALVRPIVDRCRTREDLEGKRAIRMIWADEPKLVLVDLAVTPMSLGDLLTIMESDTEGHDVPLLVISSAGLAGRPDKG